MITTDQQCALIERQIAEWEQARYYAELSHRVHTKIKSESTVLHGFVEQMTRAEMALDELQKALKELEHA